MSTVVDPIDLHCMAKTVANTLQNIFVCVFVYRCWNMRISKLRFKLLSDVFYTHKPFKIDHSAF